MNLITLDFETYFDADYTLSKMTTEAYVRDPRFKAHMCGFKDAMGEWVWPDINKQDTLNLNENAVLCHHAQFDGLILSHHYGIRPAFWFDTLSMARLVFPHAKSHSLGALAKMLGLPEKTVPYESFKGVRDLPPDLYQSVAEGCINDVELTYAVFQKLLPFVPAEELRIIDLTIRLFTEPALALDRPRMQDYLAKTQAEKEALLHTLGVTKEDLQSADKFAALLRQLGVEPPVKPSPSNPEKLIYAFAKTDKEMKELLDDDNLQISTLCEARLGQKSTLGETRSQRMLDMDLRGPLCVYLNYCGAHTLRWSGGDKLNWQNFTRGGEIRKSILAPNGYQVVVIDNSQIECRLVNWQAGQWDILEKFRNKEDIYSQLATQFYGELVDKSKPEKRGTGKQIELSCGFRAGADSIKETARRGTYGPPVHLTDAMALAARDLYRSTHLEVVKLWQYGDKVVLPCLLAGTYDFMWGPLRVSGKRIYAPNGAWLDYTHLKYGDTGGKYGDGFYTETARGGIKNMHGGILTQNIIELMSRMLLASAMLQIAPRYRIVTCTHDEIVYLAKTEDAQEALDFGLGIMKKAPAWCEGIPLDAEGGFDVRYSK
jgi:hypothetical protein